MPLFSTSQESIEVTEISPPPLKMPSAGGGPASTPESSVVSIILALSILVGALPKLTRH